MRFIVNIFGTDYRIANPQTADRGTHYTRNFLQQEQVLYGHVCLRVILRKLKTILAYPNRNTRSRKNRTTSLK